MACKHLEHFRLEHGSEVRGEFYRCRVLVGDIPSEKARSLCSKHWESCEEYQAHQTRMKAAREFFENPVTEVKLDLQNVLRPVPPDITTSRRSEKLVRRKRKKWWQFWK